MEATATLRYLKASAQKVRLVVDLVRGKRVEEAIQILHFTKKTVAKDLENDRQARHELIAQAAVFRGAPVRERGTEGRAGGACDVRALTIAGAIARPVPPAQEEQSGVGRATAAPDRRLIRGCGRR